MALRRWLRQTQQVDRPNLDWINVYDGMDAQIVHSSLENYLDQLQHEHRTKYDGDPKYCREDEEFLTDTIERVRRLLYVLKTGHPLIVTKG